MVTICGTVYPPDEAVFCCLECGQKWEGRLDLTNEELEEANHSVIGCKGRVVIDHIKPKLGTCTVFY